MTKGGEKSALTPQLKSWLDNCLVPVLVQEFLAKLQEEKSVVPEVGPVAECNKDRPVLAGIVQ